MVRFRNLGRDINANPLQFRVWMTDGYPDLNAELYTGYKAGSNNFIETSTHIVADDNAIVDFNYIKPTEWRKTSEVLPELMELSSLAIIDGYCYLFGGRGTNKILKASAQDPGRWEDTGATLPVNQLYGSHCAVLDDGYVYLFGGNDGYATKHVFSAHSSNPLNWTDHGELLPEPRYCGTLLIENNVIYLFGGHSINNIESTIYSAQDSSPLVWSNTAYSLPEGLYASQGSIINDFFYLYGGNLSDHNPTEKIYKASTSTLSFSIDGYLPYKCSYGQLGFVGNNIYYFTPTASNPDGYGDGYTSQTRILNSTKSNPLNWEDTGKIIPAELSMSQIGIIYDRFFAFGGAGNTAIFATEPEYIFKFNDSDIVTYGVTTRTLFQAANSVSDKFEVLCSPPWKTDYKEN